MTANGLGVEGRGRQDERAASWELPAEPGSAAAARALTGQALREWRVNDQGDVDDIVLMVDELVTNAIVHGRGGVRLRLRLEDTLLLAEIGDDHPASPTPPGPGHAVLEWAEDGRGLLLVGALATAFGTRPEARGKTVWFSRALSAVDGRHTATDVPPAEAASVSSP
ncbi:ATP-binding protein [Actinomadura vinacea]|uniref:ATP-binding protein n=1 Tax=Actinomadura vinacea TaxID=115336 RepID=A0ABP5X266_9ACTN